MKPGPFWEAISETSAVAWKAEVDAGGATFVSGPAGLVVWGPVNWRVLQSLGLSRWTHSRRGFPTWPGETPPSEKELRRRWRASARYREPWDEPDFEWPKEDVRDLFIQLNAHTPNESWVTPFSRRGNDEPVDDFYMRVAEFYSSWLRRNGKPTQMLAESAGVPKTTAARWVNESRHRGCLPPTTRGKSRS